MKFAVAPEHTHFFQHHRSIEFENLVTPEQLESIQHGMDEVLVMRLENSPPELDRSLGEQLFLNGRDLWRSHATIKGLVLQKSLAEVAGELLGQRPIRIGYDQLLPTSQRGFHPFLGETHSLKEMSSLQGVLGGLMLCLKGNEDLEKIEHSLFSFRAGSGVFFDAELPIDFTLLQKRPKCLYLLIVYTHSITAYIYKKDDPHTHAFRDWGYGIGDPLTNQKNPLVYK